MNAGARRARGGTLLFLHADCTLPDGYQDLIETALGGSSSSNSSSSNLRDPGSERLWGAWRSIHVQGCSPITAAALRFTVGLRTSLLTRPYGDQGLFVRSEAFWRLLGGFEELPLLEDVRAVRRLAATAGRPALVPGALPTSGRRWAKLGLLRTTLINQAILIGEALGVSVDTLAAWYHGSSRRITSGRKESQS